MILDRQVQKSFELATSLQGIKNGPTLLSVLDQTLTSMGGRTLYQWLMHPLLSLKEINQRQDGVEELTKDSSKLQTVRSLFKGVKDMERTLSRLNYGVANARDLINLKDFFQRVPRILEV